MTSIKMRAIWRTSIQSESRNQKRWRMLGGWRVAENAAAKSCAVRKRLMSLSRAYEAEASVNVREREGVHDVLDEARTRPKTIDF